ncbi:uncharacterized protein LOC103314323 isoform X2 [Tribolium castaneum]|uniref:uncharacterized protein LOC103314323 isoform X2 n=1 Tax=Tribolium castaneum TaxID=7070 RepID=UPI0030FE8B61
MRVSLLGFVLVVCVVRQSWGYKELSMENDELCSPINKKRRVRLDKGHRSGLVVRQFRLQDHSLDWTRNFKCRFEVTPSSSREGVIAVIQHLSFRKNASTDECVDYVQFTRKDGSSSQKYCGRFNAALYMDHNFVNTADPISSGTAFVDDSGELEVAISVSREHLENDEEMDLSIVFTAFRHCSQVLKRDTSYRPCSEKRREYCIYSGFFMDSFVNCPFPDCEDEQGCSQTPIPRVIELNEQTGSRASAPPPNASSANQIEADKDLPPSYESLFPSR